MRKKQWEADAQHQPTTPLVYTIPYAEHIPERNIYSTVFPGTEEADRKAGVLPVDVTVSTGGKAQIMFEYRDGHRYGVDITRLFEEVDRFHQVQLENEPKVEQPKEQPKKRQKKVVSAARKVAPSKRKIVLKPTSQKRTLKLKRK